MIQASGTVRLKNDSGQALVEYIFVLIAIVGVYAVINRSVLRGIGRIWLSIGQSVAAACPKCSPPEEMR